MSLSRAQWPHTVDDIRKALDGVWGVVAAIADSGNMLRLERSLKEPVSYKFSEYQGTDEAKLVRELDFAASEKEAAIDEFAGLLGFKKTGF